jgi:hypothetical protein
LNRNWWVLAAFFLVIRFEGRKCWRWNFFFCFWKEEVVGICAMYIAFIRMALCWGVLAADFFGVGLQNLTSELVFSSSCNLNYLERGFLKWFWNRQKTLEGNLRTIMLLSYANMVWGVFLLVVLHNLYLASFEFMLGS